LFVSLISTSIATTLFFLGTKKLGAEKVSSFMFIAPASAVIVGALALGERLNIFTLIGIAASILAVYMLNRIWIFKSHK
ncbi:MAG: DMT family transporter, partial [Campylobacteraceae bacterium]|nr:DMT family transporter [Campylobacteraceae bacterium]